MQQSKLGEKCGSRVYEHAAKPEFSYRLQWEPGTMALWDNRATWHNALNDYHGHRRVMHRITVQGVPLPTSALFSHAGLCRHR
jgi:alpha-ketoglutarate-dependent taurine dioxygenase